jgi:chromosomal replication initiator protein
MSGIWQEFLQIIRAEMGSQMVETWLKAVSLQQWDSREKTVYLMTPNQFVKDWLRSHYVTLFDHHLRRLFNVDSIKIVFVDEQASTTVPAVNKKEGEADGFYVPAQVAVGPVDRKNGLSRRIEGKSPSQINSNYTFDNFIVGPSNQLAYAAAKAVIERPGKVYNPLFMYGESGLGKTHLLHAIGNEIRMRSKRASVLYQTADRFVNEFINAIRFDKVHQFQIKYKDIDVLLIDDVQFISNKDQTQEAFFHIFNTLYDTHKQIVFSSDTYPQNMSGIAERLRSRLEWGLVTDIQLPLLETKIAILKKKAEMNNVQITDEVAHFLACRVVSNIRVLEGSLIQVMAVASLMKQPITVELAKKIVVRQTAEAVQGGIDLEHILKCVCDHYSYNIADLRSNTRAKEVAHARQVAMYFMKKLTNKSLQEIGFFLGRKNHSTVIHGLEKVQTDIKKNSALSAQLVRLEEKILG